MCKCSNKCCCYFELNVSTFQIIVDAVYLFHKWYVGSTQKLIEIFTCAYIQTFTLKLCHHSRKYLNEYYVPKTVLQLKKEIDRNTMLIYIIRPSIYRHSHISVEHVIEFPFGPPSFAGLISLQSERSNMGFTLRIRNKIICVFVCVYCGSRNESNQIESNRVCENIVL